MEHLSEEQINLMSHGELAARFNILVKQLAAVHNEALQLPVVSDSVFFSGSCPEAEKEAKSQQLRMRDKLLRPFAATAYCESGVRAHIVKPGVPDNTGLEFSACGTWDELNQLFKPSLLHRILGLKSDGRLASPTMKFQITAVELRKFSIID
jgi:hypothetical protein